MSPFSSNNDDIFRTQADNRFNTFSEPLNSVNMTPGNWGVDPHYLTPSYLSPFRPRYQGPTGDSSSSFRPGFATSVNQVFNPFAPGGDNYGGNYWNQTSPYYDAMSNKPMDATMGFAQNWALPAAMGWAAYKFGGSAATKFGSKVGGRFLGGLSMGLGFSREVTTGALRAGRWTGGLAGGMLLPMLGVEAGAAALDKAVFDPYMAQRRMSSDLRDNFRGITYGEGSGDVFTGGGLSRRSAANIARNVSHSAASDRTFNQEEAGLLTDYASRAGLLDNTTSSQMAKRFEGIMKQVKLVMSVANTTDFKETIEIMSKMQMAGVAPNQLSGVMGTMAAAASMGGQSVQKLLNTVGTQGQYVFGSAGLTPYLGQTTAFNTNASFASAYRSGLISPALMARMGGTEGATQSALAGTVAAYRTPYANMQAYNSYFGGGETGNVVTNVARFGGQMARNPFQSIGRFMMSKDALASRHLSDQGLMGEQEQIMQIARSMNQNIIGADGKIDEGSAYMIMTNQMGMTHEMAVAKLAQFSASRDPKTVNQNLAALGRASTDQLLNYQRQEGLNKGIFQQPYDAVMGFGMGVQKAGSRMVGRFTETVGNIADNVQASINESLYRINPEDKLSTGFEDDVKGSSKTYLADTNSMKLLKGGDANRATLDPIHVSDLEKINKLAKGRNNDAITFLDKASTKEQKSRALLRMANRGEVSPDYSESKEATSLIKSLDLIGVVETSEPGRKTNQDRMIDSLTKLAEHGNVSVSLEYLDKAHKVFTALTENRDLPEADLKRFKELARLPEDATAQEVKEKARHIDAYANEQGLINVRGLKAGSKEELFEQLKKLHLDPRSATVLTRSDSDSDVKSANQQSETQRAIASQKARIVQLYKEGQIDGKTTNEMLNGLDNKETISNFSHAVDDFGKYVSSLKNGTESKDSSKGSFLMSPLTGNGQAVLSMRSDKPK